MVKFQTNYDSHLCRNNFWLSIDKWLKGSKSKTGEITPKTWLVWSINDQKGTIDRFKNGDYLNRQYVNP